MRPSQYQMIPVEQALAIVLARTPVLEAEHVGLEEAVGRVLAEQVRATESLPPLAASAVDGYALRSADGIVPRRVLGEITAGRRSATRVESGGALRIMTGAPLPAGADAVVMVEETNETSGSVTILRPVTAGENVIPVGLDVEAQQLVLDRGSILGPAEVAMLATIGRADFPVHRQPMVAVLSTGDELVAPDSPIGEGKIRDSNRYGLLAAVAEAGGMPVSLGIAHDDAAEQEARIRRGLQAADVVLTSGGVSVGSRDLIKPILERLGTVHFGRVAMKPGKPLTFATAQGKLVFGLPGFPVSSLVAFELFVRPAILKMQGRREVQRPLLVAVLQHSIGRNPERVEFQRARLRQSAGRIIASATGVQASSRLMSLVGANGLLRIPPGDGNLPAGSTVEALLTGTLLGD